MDTETAKKIPVLFLDSSAGDQPYWSIPFKQALAQPLPQALEENHELVVRHVHVRPRAGK